jgi:hypothetical protein
VPPSLLDSHHLHLANNGLPCFALKSKAIVNLDILTKIHNNDPDVIHKHSHYDSYKYPFKSTYNVCEFYQRLTSRYQFADPENIEILTEEGAKLAVYVKHGHFLIAGNLHFE